MNMEEQLLPIVPFGKYKDKSVLDLLADEQYVEWLKQQSWFSTKKQIYNIVVHQTIHTTNNSKTPQHNKLQNLFLDTINQQKLLSKICKSNLIDRINLFTDANIIRCFGKNIIPEFINKLDKTTIKFEDKFNWDLVIYYYDSQQITITSNLETELFDKIKYKEQYDIEENEKYINNLLLIDKLIEGRIKLDQEGITKYDEKMREHLDKCEKYENDLNIYFQQNPQNEKDIANYEKKKANYEKKINGYQTDKTKQICQELEINYDIFVKKYGFDRDRVTKKQLRLIVHAKLIPFIKEFEGMNTIPNFVEKLNIPTKPSLPQKYDYNEDIYNYEKYSEIFKLFEKCKKINHLHYLYSVDKLNKYKKEYENKYIKNYENKFNDHYENYRLQYYRDIIKKYYKKNVYVKKTNENQYKLSIVICHYNNAICCELKPTLSDDYPVVLRKLKTQIELTQNDKTNFEKLNKDYILIIGKFTSIDVSKEQLITIFKQSNIKVIFTDEIFETSTQVAIKDVNRNTTTEQVLFENKLIEENKFLTDNLLQTQQKLLQAEEKIRHLEEEIQSLKSQKQSKSIKDYFGKK
jgi:uncharacterized protein (DUF3820 family)